MVYRNLSKTDALKKLKSYDYTSEAKNATITNTIAQKEELDCVDASDTECYFITRQRNNFCFSSLMGSPIHLLALGLVSNVLSIVFQLGSLLDIKKDLPARAKSTIEALANSRIDFTPAETSLSNKTTGQIGNDYIRTCTFICYMFRHIDQCIAGKNHNGINMKDYDSKMQRIIYC